MKPLSLKKQLAIFRQIEETPLEDTDAWKRIVAQLGMTASDERWFIRELRRIRARAVNPAFRNAKGASR